MSRKPTTAPAFAGLPKFGADDAPALVTPPSREVREQAKAAAKAIGFGSDSATRAAAPPEAAQRERPSTRQQEPRVAQYPAHYSLRMTHEDRSRFDDYAHKHRIPKGEAIRRLLDLAEAEEARQEAPGARAKGKGGE